jgi:hypothetical protein
VRGESVVNTAVVGAHVTVCVASVVVNVIAEDVAASCVVPALIVAVSEQVPAETKATKPVDELTVQTPVVELA